MERGEGGRDGKRMHARVSESERVSERGGGWGMVGGQSVSLSPPPPHVPHGALAVRSFSLENKTHKYFLISGGREIGEYC